MSKTVLIKIKLKLLTLFTLYNNTKYNNETLDWIVHEEINSTCRTFSF